MQMIEKNVLVMEIDLSQEVEVLNAIHQFLQLTIIEPNKGRNEILAYSRECWGFSPVNLGDDRVNIDDRANIRK